jgi:hypothetical protein
MKKYLILTIAVIILTGCSKSSPVMEAEIPKAAEEIRSVETENLLNKDGMTILERYSTPEGYSRIDLEENSFGEFLRSQKLKPYGEKVLYYDGREKNRTDVYDSVYDVDIGNRDLHQCADAVMLLRGEYLYSQELYEDINFHFVSGFKAEYSKWREGYRIKVDGNNVSYYSGADPSSSYESFRKYMDMVFAYSGTISLEKELSSVDIDEMQIGDVFIKGGSPGHAVIVVDMAVNENNDKIFILAQSYMPAQQTQILINPSNKGINPWYTLDKMDTLVTPEWTFELDQLRRWIDG